MKKVLQRTLNMLMLLSVAYALILPFGYLRTEADGIIALFVGLTSILITNYILFGKITLWNKIEKDEEIE